MAQFGVTTAMVSIVLSVFMAGLGLGSWASGQWLRQPKEKDGFSALRLYALIELLIGVSGILVPYGLLMGTRRHRAGGALLFFCLLSGSRVLGRCHSASMVRPDGSHGPGSDARDLADAARRDQSLI